MVGRPPSMSESGLPDGEENTHRVWSNLHTTTLFGHVETRINALTITVAESVQSARIEAQTANNALQCLLEAAMASSTKLSDVRFTSQEIAIGKTETAISAAKAAALAALGEVDTKAQMRNHSASDVAVGVEQKLTNRLNSMEQLNDLRAKMNDIAVEKATQANEKRFEVINGVRGTIADQARTFVTVPVLEARTGQLAEQITALDRQTRQGIDGMQAAINGLASRLDRGEGGNAGQRQAVADGHMSTNSIVGIITGGVGICALIVSIVVGYANTNHTPAPPFNPTVGADTKRVDDLNNRFDALSNRMSSMQRERVTAPPP